MPTGEYSVLAEDGSVEGTERFRCAPGPVGWRYFSEIDTIEPEPHHEIALAVARNEQGWNLWRTLLEAFNQRDSIHSRHLDITDDGIILLLLYLS